MSQKRKQEKKRGMMVLGGSSHENLGVLQERVFDSCPAAKRNSLVDLVLG